MNINELAYLAQNPATLSNSSRITLLTNDEFTKGLKLGQVVEGRVLQDLGQGRYLVNLGSKENIVDTTIPFSKNDLLHGRVIGLGDRVELQRIQANIQSKSELLVDVQGQAQTNAFVNKNEQQLVNLFTKFKAPLSATDKSNLMQLMSSTKVPQNAALAGLVLQKMGLQQAPALHASVQKVLDNKSGNLKFVNEQLQALSLASVSGSEAVVSTQVNVIQRLSEQIALFSKVFPEKFLADNVQNKQKVDISQTSEDVLDEQEQDSDSAGLNLARWLFNLQLEGALSHSIFSLPLVVGEKLLNIDIAIFDQKKSYSTVDGIRYRQIHFSLDSNELGPVEVGLKIADRRLRINVMTENHAVTDFIASKMSSLKKTLVDNDWRLDEISYGTVLNKESNTVVDAVVEHFITQDSLSRLV